MNKRKSGLCRQKRLDDKKTTTTNAKKNNGPSSSHESKKRNIFIVARATQIPIIKLIVQRYRAHVYYTQSMEKNKLSAIK